MAKATVSEKDLAANMTALGGFGGLAAGGGTRRDSPFGASYVKPSPTAASPTKPVDLSLSEQRTGEGASREAGEQAPTVASTETNTLEVTPVTKEEAAPQPPARPIRTKAPVRQEARSTSVAVAKTDLSMERVTLVVEASTREELQRIARALQRRKPASSERTITANTLMRVALKVFLEELSPSDADTPGTEAELYELTKAKIRRKG